MLIDNVDNLEIRLRNLMGLTREKSRKLAKMRDWATGFSEGNPATQTEIDHQIGMLSLGDLQIALNDTQDAFVPSDIMPDEDGEEG